MSGVDSYAALCVAGKSEERRLQELKKRQQYERAASSSRPGSAHIPITGNSSQTRKYDKPDNRSSWWRLTCFTCGEPGHKQAECPKQRTESKGKGKPQPPRSNRPEIKQVQAVENEDQEGGTDLLSLFLSDSDEDI